MIFDNDYIIKEFVRTFSGLAAVRNEQGKHLLINQNWERMIGPVTGKSLAELTSASTSAIMSTTLNYCSRCDKDAFFWNKVTYHFEYFNNTKYITIRIPIRYQDISSIMILGSLYH